MTAIFNVIAVPFGYVMRYIYEFVGNYGLSIILFSLLAKLIMLPISLKQKKSMMKNQAIQPKVQELQKKYGKDQQKLNQELQDLYAREDASPMGGCGTMLLTFPIMIGLYYVISTPLTYFMRLTADQIALLATRLGVEVGTGAGGQMVLAGLIRENFAAVEDISSTIMAVDYNFLGFNLAATPNFKAISLLWLIPLFSGLTAMLMSWVTQKLNQQVNPKATEGSMGQQNKMMLLMTPVMSLVFGFILPAGLGLYWIVNNIFSTVQEIVFQRFLLRDKEKDGVK